MAAKRPFSHEPIDWKLQESRLYTFGPHAKYFPAWDFMRSLIEDGFEGKKIDYDEAISAEELMRLFDEKHAADPEFKIDCPMANTKAAKEKRLTEISHFRAYVIGKRHNNNPNNYEKKTTEVSE